MAATAVRYITEEEYLACEGRSEEKHEYYQGRIYAMAGSSPEHALITSNASAEMRSLVRDTPCNVYASDLRIRVDASGLYTYPDMTVACGELRLTDGRPPSITNPALIVEVASESTYAYDSREKWRHYQTIESLRDYILIWQKRPRIEHYSRQSADLWTYRMLDGLDQRLHIETLGGELLLSEVYRGITFPETPPLR